MQCWWTWLPLLMMALNAGAELYLLKHDGYLYCATDDEDTPALAWNHNLDMENEPLDSVYWSTPALNFNIDCRPKLGNGSCWCGHWDIRDWRIVRSYEKALPPVFDFRWNDLQRFVEPRGKITHNKLFPNKSAQHLYIPVSLLVRNSAIVILRSGNEDWRFAIDAQIETEPKIGVELWRWNTTTKSSEIIGATYYKGQILHNGTRWTTVLLKYEARSQGDILKLFNPEAGLEHTWETKQTIKSVKELRFYSHRDSPGLFGHWRFHLYNILVPKSSVASIQLNSHFIIARERNRLCFSITYIAPHTNLSNNEGYVHLYSRNYRTIKKIKLHSTGNEWKTVKHSFSLLLHIIVLIYSPRTNIHGFAIGEIRACSEGEFRVSRIVSSAASECTDLKHNITVKFKSAVMNHLELDLLGNSTLDYKSKCVGIIPHIQDCRGVTFCSSSVCTCAPGYQGANCQLGCSMGFYGSNCSLNCNRNCKDGAICNSITGKCIRGCIANWTGDKCEECAEGRFGINCSSICSDNCMEYCNKDNGSCLHGCKPGWKGDTCNKEPLSTLSIIFISIGVLSFVLMGIGLMYLFLWNVRLHRVERNQTKSVDHELQI